jgi:Arc/MetJ family transcription regulator
MAKHLVDIDPDLLESARAAAGTPTIKATVEAGLRQLAGKQVALRHVRRMRKRPPAVEWVEKARAPRAFGR